MIQRCRAVVSLLVLGLAVGPSTPTLLAQSLTEVRSAVDEFSSTHIEGFRVVTTRVTRAGHTSERLVTEGPSINGGSTVLSAVEDQEIQVGADMSRRTRREFVTDTNGRSRVISTLEEHRMVGADGGERIVRAYTEPDVNGRVRMIRREHEDTVAKGDGIFTTQIEVFEPAIRGNGLEVTERVEQREHRDGDRVVELDRTTYTDSLGGAWVAREQRVLSQDASDGTIRSVESVYTADDTGQLVQSDRIVSREWTGPGGREHRTEEIFSREVADEIRAATPQLRQRVEIVRTIGLDGRWSTTRTVRAFRNGRLQVVERVVERARPTGRGDTVIEQETQRLDVNGRLQTEAVRQTRESVM